MLQIATGDVGHVEAVQQPPIIQFDSFIYSLRNFEDRTLERATSLWSGFNVTFGGEGDVRIHAQKMTSAEGHVYLSLQPRNMERSTWFAIEIDLPTAVIAAGTVVVVATEAFCPQVTTSYAAVRVFDHDSGWIDNASMEIDFNAERTLRSHPIVLPQSWIDGLKGIRSARVILFVEARNITLNIFDFQVQFFNLRGAFEQMYTKTLDAFLQKRVLAEHSKTWGIGAFSRTEWTNETAELRRDIEFEPRLSICYPETEHCPTIHATNTSVGHTRHLDLTATARLTWRSLELRVGDLANAKIGALTVRASSPTPLTITPFLRVINGPEHSDFGIFNSIHLTNELTTYSQVSSLAPVLHSFTPASHYKLILFISPTSADFAFEALAFSAEV